MFLELYFLESFCFKRLYIILKTFLLVTSLTYVGIFFLDMLLVYEFLMIEHSIFFIRLFI